jgi:hypothetical protein
MGRILDGFSAHMKEYEEKYTFDEAGQMTEDFIAGIRED